MESEKIGAPENKKNKVVVVGGSIAGLSCALALNRVGWDVTVVEKSSAPPVRSSTGAGLGLDPQSMDFLRTWTAQNQHFDLSTLPLTIDMNSAVDSERKKRCRLTLDEKLGFRAAHWHDVHELLYQSLPPNILVHWGYQFLSFATPPEISPVEIRARVLQTGETVEMAADLVVAADGCLSAIRHNFLPDHRLRYSGYCAWRGVLDFSESETPETILGLRKAYPELGQCLFFDLSPGTHCVLYELYNQRINWLWYVNQPEPKLEGTSVTMKASDEMIKNMHDDAERTWIPALATVMKETKDPFINAIYDSEPLPRLFWGNVVLVGDAAHPTTPHGLRSTNMAIADAGVLANCLAKWGPEGLGSALEDFQSLRLPVVSQQVLHARRLGRLKQGLAVEGSLVFDPMVAGADARCEFLEQKSMPFFSDAPLSI